MPDREEVINGLEKLQEGLSRTRCLWTEPTVQALADAITLLKEQQPRVLSLREITGKEAVWNEWTSVDGFVECMLFYREDAVDYVFAECNGLMLYFDKAEYGSSWRCWDKRPTVEQMHDEQWENR